jgi:hypothetical protein
MERTTLLRIASLMPKDRHSLSALALLGSCTSNAGITSTEAELNANTNIQGQALLCRQALRYRHIPAACRLALNKIAANLEGAFNRS